MLDAIYGTKRSPPNTINKIAPIKIRRSPPGTMAKTLFEILKMSWERQADHLHGLSLQELQVLFYQLHRIAVDEEENESFEKFYLAVISIIRDYGENR